MEEFSIDHQLEKALEKLEMISGIIHSSPIDEKDKKLFADILAHAYEKRFELIKSYESNVKRKHKRIKFHPNHF